MLSEVVTMEQRKLIETLRATLDPNQRHQAEEQLSQIHKIIGFAPSLLQVIMMSDVDMPVRQAGAVYLKNLINLNWADKEVEPGTPLPFTIHEQDRAMIRDAIVDAVVLAPELIKAQLCVCVNTIVKHDFPGRWTQIVDKISIYLQNPEPSNWTGALLCLYQLVKNFEYKKAEERAPLNEAMNLLFPMIYQLIGRLLQDQSEQSVLLQKQILKIYFALTQYVLPLDLISREVFSQWMAIVRDVADRPVPDQTNQIDEEERPDLPWWKCKKWALHILHRMFERYGSPGSVTKDYKEFSEWYLKTFSGGILEVLLKILDQYRRKTYVSPRVLQQTLNYINIGVSHAHSWKFLKPHMFAIIQEVLFPLMSYSDADDELWNSDPHDYIRVKFDVPIKEASGDHRRLSYTDIFEGFISPVAAAQTLLHSACKKRKDMLQKTMQFILQVLTAPTADAKQKDGVLHMVGSVAEILLKKQMYKDQMDSMIQQYVFPEFRSPHGHMRARACWVLHHFSEINYKQEQVLAEAVCLIVNALLTDGELPVKVEAAIALQMTLTNQERSHKYVEPQVKPVTLELLKIIRETENDDLTNVMQLVVMTYTDQLKAIAVEICQHLAQTFSQVLDSDEGSDEKAIMAMGLLNTIETLLNVMEEQPEIIAQLQPTVLGVIGHIFSNSVMDVPIKEASGDHRRLSYTEFYEEALSLVYDLTSKTISPEMWKVFELMYQIFEKDGFDYFTDMMPALHNYVTVDTEAFLANPQYVEAMYKMAKAVLTGDAGEDPESHGAKLLEVIILQCKGRIDQCIGPFVELVLQRLLREVKTSELRTMCLQVVISALYYNPQLLFSIIDAINLPLPQGQCASTNFIKQWLNDTDCFLGLHDRKLCVLGMCTLISMTPQRPSAINECVQQIVPSLIVLFDGLKRAYAEKAQEQEEEEDEDDDEIEEEVLSSDEDELNEDDAEYLEKLQEKVKSKKIIAPFEINSVTIEDEVSDDDSDDDYVPLEETALESYTTPLDEENCPIDEYVAFKEVLQSLQGVDQAWYNALTAHLTTEQQKALHDIMVLADQRKAAAESKRIEQSGGYAFVQHTVPTSFNFGGTPLGR